MGRCGLSLVLKYFGDIDGDVRVLRVVIIGQALVQQGRSVYFRSCSLLVQELLIAKRDLKLSRYLKRLARFETIVIDDIGYPHKSYVDLGDIDGLCPS